MKENISISGLNDLKITRELQENGSILFQIADETEEGQFIYYPLYKGITLAIVEFKMNSIPVYKIGGDNCLLINYCVDGRCEVDLGNDRYLFLESGQISIDVNSAQNDFRCPTRKYMGVEILIDLDVLCIEKVYSLADLEIDIPDIRDRFCSNDSSFISFTPENLNSIFRQIYENRTAGFPVYKLLLFQVMMALKELSPVSKDAELRWLTKGQIEIARRVENTITSNLKNKFSIPDLAATYGISASSLKDYFQRVFGEPISVYLRNVRMEKAKYMLEETNLTVTDIAFTVGYENQSKFAAAFKRSTGVSPLEYRRLMRSVKL